jgi:uncharacterized protein
MLERSPFLGPVFESFVAAEILKHQINAGRARALYYFRDQQGLEVDFVVPSGSGTLALVETKAARTVGPADARSMHRLTEAISGHRLHKYVAYRSGPTPLVAPGLGNGVRALTPGELLAALP